MKRKILIIYAWKDSSIRATTEEHLFSFRRYAHDIIYYANVLQGQFPEWLKKVDYDLIIFHTLFLANHWKGKVHFQKIAARAAWAKESKAVKVMMPQDEFINSDLYSDFINEFKIDKVFTVAPASVLPYIYRNVSQPSVQFERILTGYLDERRTRINCRRSRNKKERHVDIGYRTAGKPNVWFGRLGFMKQTIADAVAPEAIRMGLKTDISTDPEDVILGNRWYDFLLGCKYVIGCESGTSIVDPTGKIKEAVDQYVERYPTASFEEIEAQCFPGADGMHVLNAISPRHLEVCATRSCQILVEGDYDSILLPNIHYIPVKKDLSNLSSILASLGNEARRLRIVENAYRDIVASGKYTYRTMVHQIIEGSISIRSREMPKRRVLDWLTFCFNLAYDMYGFYMAQKIKSLKRVVRMLIWPIRKSNLV